MSNITVNVTNAGAANVAVSNGSTVNTTVGNGGAVNVSLGTISPGNATVVSGTLTINSTTTLAAGQQAYAKNVGTAYAASLDLGIPSGPATTVLVGNTTTLESGNASVTGVANGSNLTLSFAIPRGPAGANGSNGANGTTPTLTVGNVTTLSSAENATVTATTSNGGANVVLSFGLPRGQDGNGTSSLTLSSATPSALGTAAAGTSTQAARGDHAHALPSLSTLGAAAANHGHNYVTSLNNLTGDLTLAAGANVSLTANGSTITIASTGGGGSLDENASIDGGFYAGSIAPGPPPSGWSGAGTASNPWTTTTNFLTAAFTAPQSGVIYVTHNYTITDDGGFSVQKNGSHLFGAFGAIGAGSQYSGTVNSSAFGTCSTGDSILIRRVSGSTYTDLDTAGKVTINSMSVWIA